MSKPARRLQTRLMAVFAGFTLLAAAVFALYAMAFAYSVEDAFFEAELEREAGAQLQHYRTHGRWASPRDASVRLYTDGAAFPADQQRAHAAEPWRLEFAGTDGRHYHLMPVRARANAAPAWLVAEVSGQLVVRPLRDRLLLLLAGTGGVLVLLALGCGYWLARRTARPLARLATLVEAMTPEHPPKPFAHTFANDEVGILARGLEVMSGRVQAFVAREQEFTRDASHELRTPLTVIRSAAECLLGEPGVSAAGRQHLAHVQQSASQLEQAVTMLLSLAREEPPRRDADAVALLPVLERVVIEQSPLLQGKAVEVTVEVPHDARLALPAPVIHVLLSNLVGNAFAHTQAGQVRIDVESDRLRIANAGDVAATAVDWPQGTPFSKREGSSGFGLGLAIVRRLCERYGIDLRIAREADGAMASIALGARIAPAPAGMATVR